MNKKITSLVLAALMIAGTTSFSAFAAMADGTVVIGTKAFSLTYANDPAHSEEITSLIVAGGAIYVKDFQGNWLNNATGLTVTASVIPAVVYKNAAGLETNFDVKDTDQVTSTSTSVTSVSAIATKDVVYATTKDKVDLPATVILNLSNGTTKSVDVVWTSSTYDGTKTASYTFIGAYTLPTGVTGTKPTINATVIVGATTEELTDIGKTVTVSDELYGTYEITINSVVLDSYRNQFDDSNPADVYKVNYTYKLLSKGSSTYMGLYVYDFASVDSTGEVGYSYPSIPDNSPQELNIIGSRCTADTFIAVKNKTTSLTLVLDYYSTEGSSYKTFNIPVN